MNVVILANGEFPQTSIAQAYLLRAQHIVCCDGAINQLLASGIYNPMMQITVIGDGDSISPEVRRRCSEFIQIPEQDTNDLTKATRHCVEMGWDEITYLGATGLREDHTLGNISLLAGYAEQYPQLQIRMVSDHGMFTPVRGIRRFDSFPEQQVSLFTIGGSKVSSQGLRWELDGRHLERFWQGTLNAVVGDTFTIESSDGITLVYQTHAPKV